jgi:hypothetical protein
MADLTIHCATCHDFASPVPAGASDGDLTTGLRPQAEECLSCHRMRTMLADFPRDEPHGAECGACHNPHEQTEPGQAVQSCATGGCHAAADTLTPQHRGLDAGVLENFLNCHTAHEFRIHESGLECLSCHGDIYGDAPPGRVSGATPPAAPSAAPSTRLVSAVQSRDSVPFWHAQHRGVRCLSCHAMDRSHGELTVTSLRDCRSCHHTEPVAGACTRCHTASEVGAIRARLTRTLAMRVGSLDRPRRALPFDHRPHTGLECLACHTDGGLALSATAVDCSACHAEHHEPDVLCMSCHRAPKDGAHTTQVHLGCAGSGCHDAAPASVQNVPRTRPFCLACHQGMTDHRPGGNCEDCHSLPRPRAAPGGAAPGPQEVGEP